MSKTRPTYPPDWVSRETLAYRLDLAAGAVDQLVKRGILPEPHKIGEALRWRWSEIESRLSGSKEITVEAEDPYDQGVNREIATTRQGRPGERPALLLPGTTSRDRAS